MAFLNRVCVCVCVRLRVCLPRKQPDESVPTSIISSGAAQRDVAVWSSPLRTKAADTKSRHYDGTYVTTSRRPPRRLGHLDDAPQKGHRNRSEGKSLVRVCVKPSAHRQQDGSSRNSQSFMVYTNYVIITHLCSQLNTRIFALKEKVTQSVWMMTTPSG